MTEPDPEPQSNDSPKPAEKPAEKPEGPKARYVWQRLWFQWVLGTLVLFLFLSFVIPPVYYLLSKLSPVLTPVLLGLGLAYVFNPLTQLAERKFNMRRPFTAGLILFFVAAVLALTIPLLVVNAIHQISLLIDKVPGYTETVLGWMGSNSEDVRQRVREFIDGMDWTKVDAQTASKAVGVGVGAIFAGLGFAASAAIFLLVTAFCFFVFTWKLEELKTWFSQFVPKPFRPETFRILGLMDNTVSAIVRGRLIQSLVVMIVLCAGWWIFDVPYFLLLGVLGGALNLLPYAAIISWPLAVVLAMVDAAGDPSKSLLWAAILPTLVYVVAQSLDGWVVEPLVQGQATGMDALTVLLVVLAGGALLGILGVVLAVPIAACIKIVSQEVLLPRLRAFAEDPPDFWQKGSST